MPRHTPIGKRRLDIMIPEELCLQIHKLLEDPLRFDNRKKRGSLSTLVSDLLYKWVEKQTKKPKTTLEEV